MRHSFSSQRAHDVDTIGKIFNVYLCSIVWACCHNAAVDVFDGYKLSIEGGTLGRHRYEGVVAWEQGVGGES